MNKHKNACIFFLIFFLYISCVISSNYKSAAPVNAPAKITLASVQEEETQEDQERELPSAMVYYEEPVLNIFFHALVARPETAFTSSRKDHFLEWYVTAEEYKKILNELYKKDYVLTDIKELYEVINTNGHKRVNFKKPYIPLGKKPMVLSIDDLSYYESVRRLASIHKLVIDDNNHIAGWTADGSSGELSYDLDAVTYLEEFIGMYPDFSVRGARGIIALTGFEGVLGYRTHELNSHSYQEEKENAIRVVNRLKELGWHFASHSWGHPNLREISLTRLENDMNRWDREVRPVLGDTDLFIYPYGSGVEHIEAKHKILRDKNFNVFFGVGPGFTLLQRQSYLYFDRRNIDGFYFRVFRNRADRLFNIEDVIDAEARQAK